MVQQLFALFLSTQPTVLWPYLAGINYIPSTLKFPSTTMATEWDLSPGPIELSTVALAMAEAEMLCACKCHYQRQIVKFELNGYDRLQNVYVPPNTAHCTANDKWN